MRLLEVGIFCPYPESAVLPMQLQLLFQHKSETEESKCSGQEKTEGDEDLLVTRLYKLLHPVVSHLFRTISHEFREQNSILLTRVLGFECLYCRISGSQQ